VWLDCAKNNLKKINIESSKLVLLNCSNNKIANLDNLPNSFIYYICICCQITKFDILIKNILCASLYRNNMNKKIIKKISKINNKIEIIF